MSHSRDREIADLRANGIFNLSEIGKEYKMSRERVRQICNQMGVDSREATATYSANREIWKRQETHQLRPQVERMYAEGAYYGEICDALFLPHIRVVEIISEIDNEFVQISRQAAMHAKNNNVENNIRPPNEDDPRTRWTPEKITEALVAYSNQHHGGRLPSNLKYQRDAAGNIDLPSSATVRNTLGKWAEVRQKIIQINTKENA